MYWNMQLIVAIEFTNFFVTNGIFADMPFYKLIVRPA